MDASVPGRPSILIGLVLSAIVARCGAADAPAAPHDEAVPPEGASLPAEVDLRPALVKYHLEPRGQGARSTCSVFTTAAALEYALARQSGRGRPLSPEFLNWGANQINGNRDRDRGQFFHDLLAGYEKFGVCREADFPYRETFDPQLAPDEDVQQRALRVHERKLAIHWICRWSPTQGLSDAQFAEIKRVLAAGWPVAAGSDHSRLLVGYRDDATAPGGGVFSTKDSGVGRFDEVSYEFVKTRVADAFWVESQREKPKR